MCDQEIQVGDRSACLRSELCETREAMNFWILRVKPRENRQQRLQLYRKIFRYGLLSFMALGGCSEDCPWSEKGLHVDIRVGVMPEGWPAPNGECQLDWGIEPDTLISGRIVALQEGKDSGCAAGVLESPGLSGWSWQIQPNHNPDVLASLLTTYRITRGACAATLDFALTGRDSAQCGTQKDAPCAILLQVTPEPASEADCPPRCRQVKLNVIVNRG